MCKSTATKTALLKIIVDLVLLDKLREQPGITSRRASMLDAICVKLQTYSQQICLKNTLTLLFVHYISKILSNNYEQLFLGLTILDTSGRLSADTKHD